MRDSHGWVCTPLLKSNRNLCCNVKWWYEFSMHRFEIFHVTWWGLLHLLWKISRVYVIASRLCEHSNVVRFQKRQTLQHGHKYGDILKLYGMINTYEWFTCYNSHHLCPSNKSLDVSSIYCFLVKTLLKYPTRMSSYPIPCHADMQRALPAGTSSYWVMPSSTVILNLSIFRDMA